MAKTKLHIIVNGCVQGVWFRASTKEQADTLGITGWIRNLPTGQVECVISGDNGQIKSMINWLHNGPRLASVSGLDQEPIDCEDFTDFEIR